MRRDINYHTSLIINEESYFSAQQFLLSLHNLSHSFSVFLSVLVSYSALKRASRYVQTAEGFRQSKVIDIDATGI